MPRLVQIPGKDRLGIRHSIKVEVIVLIRLGNELLGGPAPLDDVTVFLVEDALPKLLPPA